jgi:uncharacterized repeat protein (TIGR03803 family)
MSYGSIISARTCRLIPAVSLLAGALAIFASQADAQETVLHSFSGTDGENVVSGLVLGPEGQLYGTARDGGGTNCIDYFSPNTLGCGTVYELTPPLSGGTTWTFNVIYTFTGGADGAFPATLALASNGDLYGTTYNGGLGISTPGSGSGVLFRLAPPKGRSTTWTYTTLYSFCSQSNCTDGNNGADGLLLSGNAIYGATPFGGTAGNGTIFKYDLLGGKLTTLYSFQGNSANDGSNPFYGVVADEAGNLFGETGSGGGTSCVFPNGYYGCGTVFELSPIDHGLRYQYSVLYRFQGEPDGAAPTGRLLLYPISPSPEYMILGVAGQGGDTGTSSFNGYGAAYQLANSGALWTETLLTDFGAYTPPNTCPPPPNPQGSYPNGNLALASDGTVWLTTYGGGCPYDNFGFYWPGTITQLVNTPSSGGQWPWVEWYSFEGGTDGVQPQWGLIAGSNFTFYGTTSLGGSTGCPELGGAYGCGTVFQFIPPDYTPALRK